MSNQDYTTDAGVHHRVTDDRRNKIYKRECRVSVSALVPKHYSWHAVGKFSYALRQALAEALTKTHPECKLDVSELCPNASAWCAWVTVSRSFSATKPSNVVSEAVAESWVIRRAELVHLCEELTEQVEQERTESETLEHKRDLALACLDDLRTRAIKQAKLVCRYEQRLAALEAEYKAEYKLQAEAPALRETVATWLREPEEGEEGEALDPVVGEVVLAKLVEYCAARPEQTGRGRYRLPSGGWLDSKAGQAFTEALEKALKDYVAVSTRETQ